MMTGIVVTMSADEAKLWKAQQKIYDQQLKYEKRLAATATTSRRAAESIARHHRKQKTSLENLGGKVKAYAAGYATVGAGVQAVVAYLEDQIELQREALRLAVDTGKAQQEAAKNLTGFSTAQKAEVFNQAVRLQADVGFPDLPKLQQALGQVTSLTGGDLDLAKDAVSKSAELNVLTPDGLAPLAAAIADTAKATGVDDTSKVTGFLLETQAASHIRDLSLLTKNITPVLATATGSFDGSDEEVARQASALFAHLSQKVADDTGERTKTASVQLLAGLDKFFDGLPEFQATQAKELGKLLAKQQTTEGEQLSIDKAQFDLADVQRRIAGSGTPRTDEQRADLTELKLRERSMKLKLDEARASAGLTQEETERLKSLKAQVRELNSVRDGVTPMGRINALQQNPYIREEFLSKASFGEESFRQPITDALTAGSDASKAIARTVGSIGFNEESYAAAKLESQRGITQTQRFAIGAAQAEARKQLALSNPVTQAKGSVGEQVADALKRNRLNNAYGFSNPITEFENRGYIAEAETIPDAYDRGIEMIQQRMNDFRFSNFSGRLSEADKAEMQDLDRTLSDLRSERADILGVGSPPRVVATASTQQDRVVTQPRATASGPLPGTPYGQQPAFGQASPIAQPATADPEVRRFQEATMQGLRQVTQDFGAEVRRFANAVNEQGRPPQQPSQIDPARRQAALANQGS